MTDTSYHKRSKKSLVAKLAEACDKVGGVDKKGRNERQGYNYVKAADVAKAIRHELFSRGIILIADEKNVTEQMIETAAGGRMHYLTLTVEYTLHDGATGETLPSTAYGIAMDAGDKAIYKAKTGALKYYLRDLGLIPDELNDPENDEKVDIETDARIEKKWNDKTKGQRMISEVQVRAWQEACGNSGKTEAQKAIYLHKQFTIHRIEELMQKDFNDAIKWAAQCPDNLADDIALSIRAVNAAKKAQPKPGPQPVVEVIDSLPDEALD